VILEAAEEQLAERGFHDARMEDVAARAGVSVGTIYNHVGGRDALLSELMETRRRELIARVDEALERSHALAFDEQVAVFVHAVFHHFERHLPLFRVMVQEEMQPHHERKRTVLASLVERATALVERGVEAGELPAVDTELLAVLLVGMLRGVFFQALHGGGDVSGRADEVADFFVAGARR